MRWEAIIRSKWISATAIVARGRIRFDSTRWQGYGQIYQDTKRVLCENTELQRFGQPFCIIFRLMPSFDAIFLVSLQENWMTYDVHHFNVYYHHCNVYYPSNLRKDISEHVLNTCIFVSVQYVILLTGKWAKYRRQNIPWPTKKYLDNWQNNYQWNEVLPAKESNGR